MFEIVEELSLLDKLLGTFKYIIASWVTGAFLSIPIVTLIFRDSPENEENSVSENKESVHDFVRKNLKFIIPVQLALGVLGLELFGILVFGRATLIELLGLFSTLMPD